MEDGRSLMLYEARTLTHDARRTGSGAPSTSVRPLRAAPRRVNSQFGADNEQVYTYPNTMAAAHTHTAPAPSDRRPEGRAGSRRIFPPQFKLQVLEAYRRDIQCRGNQRATARKFGIHRRQIQKWLQAEPALRAALLRRAPQPAPSPPPYAVGSPESARLPTPPPPPPAMLPTPVQVSTPIPVQIPVPVPVPATEPIDLSVRRITPHPYQSRTAVEPQRKPFKLFRPYLLGEEEEEEKRPAIASLPVSIGGYASAFVPLQSAAGCSLVACSAPRWASPLPSFPAPLR